MKVIIAGSRKIDDYERVKKAIKDSGFEITTVISGHARGVDTFGEIWARENNIPCEVFDADWEKFGRAAGPIRNGWMAEVGEALIAIWDNESRGTQDMVRQAKKKGLKIFEDHKITGDNSNGIER